MKKVHRVITIDADKDEFIRKNLPDRVFSGMVDKWLEEEFMSEEAIKEKIEEHKKEISNLKNQLRRTRNIKKRPLKKMSPEEREFWESSVQILTKDYSFLDGRIKLYTNLFLKPKGVNMISTSDFLAVLEKFKSQNF